MTSVLSNFICDAGLTSPDRLLDAANAELHDHVQALHKHSLAHPHVKIVVVPPLARTNPDWFNPYLACLTANLYGEISKIGNRKFRYLSPFISPPHYFEADGIHLNHDSGSLFIQFVLSGVDQVFPAVEPASPGSSQAPVTTSTYAAPSLPVTQFPSGVPVHAGPSHGIYTGYQAGFGSASSQVLNAPEVHASYPVDNNSSRLALEFGRVSSALDTLTGLTTTLRTETKTRREQDNLIFARLKEDRDFELNKNREDRFTVTGLRTELPAPSDPKERKEFYRLRLAELVAEACPEADSPIEVLDVFVNMRYGMSTPFLEGRMNSAEASAKFRAAASQLAKDGSPKFCDLFIANAVTLATRVRIEILRAIAKKLTTADTDSFVQGFSSRPLLHYYTRDHVFRSVDGTNRSYTFVETVAKFGSLVQPHDLLSAYKRARPAFNGCLEQYFVVLREDGPSGQALQTGSNLHELGSRGGLGWGGTRGRSHSGRSGRGNRGQRGYRGSPHGRGGASQFQHRGRAGATYAERKRVRSEDQESATPTKKVTPDELME